jgi:hypothetical protein
MKDTGIENKTRSGYIEISLEEMKNFLEPLGFIMHKRDAKTEWVANKIFIVEKNLYLIRIYTSINPEERSRGSGTDAIRVGIFTSNGEWVFGTKRVNRTKNWRKAIVDRVKELEDRLFGGEKYYVQF